MRTGGAGFTSTRHISRRSGAKPARTHKAAIVFTALVLLLLLLLSSDDKLFAGRLVFDGTYAAERRLGFRPLARCREEEVRGHRAVLRHLT